MTAFEKTPLAMRERLATFTNGTTRLLGGSADTLYIPGHSRRTFMEVLALFLDTDCFLEIATPTAVHLVAPPDEILYVDHVSVHRADTGTLPLTTDPSSGGSGMPLSTHRL